MAVRGRVVVASLVVCISACSLSGSSSSAHHLEISGSEIGPGDRVSIRVVDLDDEVSEVEVVATLVHGGIASESRAVFELEADGVVDLDTQKPIDGTYNTADSMGLIWSLASTGDETIERGAIGSEDLDEWSVQISAKVGGDVIDQRVLTMDPAPGVELVDSITDTGGGFAAVLFADPSRCPCPTVIVFGGSSGGMRPQPGAALASEGYAVAVIAYFGFPGLPSILARIDPKAVTAALDWALEYEVASVPVAVMGVSRGSELAVEAALRDDRIGALVLGAPSSARWSGFGGPAWTEKGVPLPFLVPTGSPGLRNGALTARPVFETVLDQVDPAVDDAFLAVDEVVASVLLISGSDDQVWPAELMAEQIVERRCQAGEAVGETINIVHPGAGHWFSIPPPWPVPGPTYEFASSVYASGGMGHANALAAEATWQSLLGYLGHRLDGLDDPRYPNPSC